MIMGALWMGDLLDYMDDEFILAAFRTVGEHENIVNVRVMNNRYTAQHSGYCFINFYSDNAAVAAMHKLNGSVVPNSQPNIRFRLNHRPNKTAPTPNSGGGGGATDKQFTLWVSELSTEVDDFSLYKTFSTRYSSIKSARVICDPTTEVSKGFAFVRFCSEEEYRDALTHMNNFSGLGGNALTVSHTAPPRHTYPGMNEAATYNPQYYEQYWQNYAIYYDHYNTGYVHYDQPRDQATPPNADDYESVEWDAPLDVEELNRHYMEESEALWTKLEEDRWSFWKTAAIDYP